MKDSARYVKIVEWSDEDQCFVGSCPGLFDGGCHGDDEKAVLERLRQQDAECRLTEPLPPTAAPGGPPTLAHPHPPCYHPSR